MINIIVAHSENNVIGKDNRLIWRQSADLKRFKALTTGKTVIMGRKTYDSIGRPLPNRRNIVITRQTDLKIEGVEIVNSLEDAILLDSDVFILGGGEIYKKSIILADKIYLTKIHSEFEGDTFFPRIDMDEWSVEDIEFNSKDEKNEFDYSFVNLIRK